MGQRQYRAGDRPTERQLRILQMVADGYMRFQIAMRLQTSQYLVNNELNAVYCKLGAQGGPNAVALAIAQGLIKTPAVTHPVRERQKTG